MLINAHLRRHLFGILGFLCGIPPLQATECPQRVRIVYADGAVPPFYNGQGQAIPEDPGLLVKWTLDALKKTDCNPEVQLSRLPQRRVELELEQGSKDLVPAMAPSPERVKNFKFPGSGGVLTDRLAIARGNLSFYALQGTESGWNDNKKLGNKITVGISRGSITEFVAAQNGWKTEVAIDGPANFQKLLLGRVQVVLDLDLTSNSVIKEIGDGKIEKLSPPVVSLNYYPAFSRQFFENHPEFSQQFWLHACKESRTYFTKMQGCAP